jgi:hypothetical protein
MIKKVWTDPVWSKVIAAGILMLITISYTKFLSMTENLSFKDAFDKTLEIKVTVVYVITALILYWIISWLFKRFFKKENSVYNSKQQKLQKFNKTIDPKSGLQFKWRVFFDSETPFISDLTVFCTRHEETPIRFMNGSCPIQDCENSKQRIDKPAIENYIESILIDKWEKIK